MTYWIYTSAGQYRWRLIAANNRIIANSGEAYRNRADCVAAIELVRKSTNTPIRDE
jgi:uncharacterized protein YegP (UPF0339 family)